MENKGNGKYTGLCVVTVFITGFLLKKIDGYKFSNLLFSVMAIFIGIIFAFIMIKTREKGLGVKHNIILVVASTIMCILSAVMLMIIQYDSQIPSKYDLLKKIVCITAIGSFFVFIIILIVYCTNYIDKLIKM